MDNHIKDAFEQAITNAKQPESWYVCLMEEVPFYVGPEEDGTWGSDRFLIQYKEFSTYELAALAYQEVTKLAKKLEQEAQRDYDQHCLHSLDWLEARGLEPNFLPEPDGPTRYYVCITETLPDSQVYGSRHYE
jgi:hypothetical protein